MPFGRPTPSRLIALAAWGLATLRPYFVFSVTITYSDKKDALKWILDAERNFKKAGYPEDLIAKSKETALNTPRKQRTERNADQVPTAFFVTTFHSGLNKVSSVLHERFHMLQESDNCRQVFARPPVKAWKRGTNIKETLCPSTLPPFLIEQSEKTDWATFKIDTQNRYTKSIHKQHNLKHQV
jgi:hypothetical protein